MAFTTTVSEKASLPSFTPLQQATIIEPPCLVQWSLDEKKSIAISECSLESGTASAEEEPETLAELYFKFGFILPFLWIAGAYIIYSPLNVDFGLQGTQFKWFHRSKTDAILDMHRRTEIKWAWRCFWALLAFMAAITTTAVVLTVVLVVKAKQH